MTNKEKFEHLLNTAILVEFSDRIPSIIEYNDFAKKMRHLFSDNQGVTVTDEEFEASKRSLQEYLATNNVDGTIIVEENENHDPQWYTNLKKNISNSYSNRFSTYLSKEKHWASSVISKLDSNTDAILNYMGDPQKKTDWTRRGLILGDIQSGKTSSYTYICNKAIDSGYKVIIVLAGMTNYLRRQTQLRLEKECVGITKITPDNPKKGEITQSKSIGVSRYGRVDVIVETFTSDQKDFSKAVAEGTSVSFKDSSVPRLFVVKKVKSVLNNLFQWFSNSIDIFASEKITVPLLLIDDESDNASVNTSEEESPSAINNGIRALLKLFARSTYVGVTATPFANIFINPYSEQTDKIDPDLFPRDFIYSMPSPSNYIGSDAIFGMESTYGENVIQEITDAEMEMFFPYGHKKDIDFVDIPNSMKEAIIYFMITNAIRDMRGHTNTHRSMLINISRFVDVQNKVRDIIEFDYIPSILHDLCNFSKLEIHEANRCPTIHNFMKIWNEYKLSQLTKISWEVLLKKYLYESNMGIKILSVNQKSQGKLDYENYPDGLRVIAIGGDCLSRGLTLEDLSVSYFYRNSQAYDTLMQMGRWFGYRPDYSDLVKIWISREACAWYRHITEATEELKIDIIRMNRNNMTPMDFGLKIKGHPDALIPTARNKMRNSALDARYVEVDIAGKLIESPRLRNRVNELQSNEQVIRLFIKNQLNKYTRNQHDDYLWHDVPANVISELINRFKSLNWNWYFDSHTLSDYILDCDQKWDVSLQQGGSIETRLDLDLDDSQIELVMESRFIDSDNNKITISGSKVRVGKGGSSRTGLSRIKQEELEKKYRELVPVPENGKYNYPDSLYLHTDRNPILFIHFIQPNQSSPDAIRSLPCKIVALGLGFSSNDDYDPKKKKAKKIKYYLNCIESEIDLASEEGDDLYSLD